MYMYDFSIFPLRQKYASMMFKCQNSFSALIFGVSIPVYFCKFLRQFCKRYILTQFIIFAMSDYS